MRLITAAKLSQAFVEKVIHEQATLSIQGDLGRATNTIDRFEGCRVEDLRMEDLRGAFYSPPLLDGVNPSDGRCDHEWQSLGRRCQASRQQESQNGREGWKDRKSRTDPESQIDHGSRTCSGAFGKHDVFHKPNATYVALTKRLTGSNT